MSTELWLIIFMVIIIFHDVIGFIVIYSIILILEFIFGMKPKEEDGG